MLFVPINCFLYIKLNQDILKEILSQIIVKLYILFYLEIEKKARKLTKIYRQSYQLFTSILLVINNKIHSSELHEHTHDSYMPI